MFLPGRGQLVVLLGVACLGLPTVVRAESGAQRTLAGKPPVAQVGEGKPPVAQVGEAKVPVTQEQALLEAAGEGFRIHRTPHFLIAHDTPPGMAGSLSTRLEYTFHSIQRFCEHVGFSARPLDRRLEVIFFNDAADYVRYARPFGFDSRGTYGFYHERPNRSAFYNVHNDPQLQELHASIEAARENLSEMEQTLKSLRSSTAAVEITYGDGRRTRLNRTQARNEVQAMRRKVSQLDARRQMYADRINRTVIQHEVAHQVLYNMGVHARSAANPKWLVEGLACMFETPPGAGGSGLFTINQARLRDFRTAITDGDPARRGLNAGHYATAVSEGRMTALIDLLSLPELFEQRGQDGARHYAAAWALLHYLHRTQSKDLPDYLQEVASRKPGMHISAAEELDLFEKHFGPVDDVFTARFGNYILSLPYRPYPSER